MPDPSVPVPVPVPVPVSEPVSRMRTVPSPAQVGPTPTARPTNTSRNAVLMVGSALTIAILNYGLNLMLGWSLSVEAYGQVGVAQTFIFICVSFLQAGFPYVVARAVARSVVTEGAADGGSTAWRTYKTAFVSTAALTALLVACLLLAYRLGWLRLEAAYGPLLALVGVVVLSLGVAAVPNAGLQGLFRFGQISLARLAEVMLNVVVSVALVMLGFGAFGALAGYAAAAILVCGLYLWFLRDASIWSTKGWSGIATAWAALPMTFGVFGTVLLTNVDLLGVKLLTAGAADSDTVVGTYQAAAVLARAPLFVSTALVEVFYPRIAREVALAGSGGRTAAAADELMTWLVLGVLPLSAILMVGAPTVLGFFFPARYAPAAPLLVVLAGSMACLILAAAITAILQASNRPRWAATAMTSAVLVQILGVVLLVPTVGPLGGAAASLVASALALLLLLWQARRIGLSIPKLAGHVSTLIWLALLMAPLRYVDADRPLAALWVSLASTLYVASCFFVGLLDADHIARAPLLARANRLKRPIQVVLGAARTLNALGRGAGYGATSR